MTNEDGFDVDSFVDEGVAKAKETDMTFQTGEEQEAELEAEEQQEQQEATETTAEKIETKTKTEATTESTEQTDSTISQLIQGTQKTEQETQTDRVPVADHIKLRQRAQAAEKRAEEAERQLAEGTQTAGEQAGKPDPLAELDDEDLVRAGTVKQVIDAKVGEAIAKVNQSLETQKAQQLAQETATKAVESEKVFKAETADYDDVTTKANTLNLITDADRTAIFAEANPAKKYYEVAKAKLTSIQTALGISPKSSTSEQTTTTEKKAGEGEEPDMSDDEILEELYGDEKE